MPNQKLPCLLRCYFGAGAEADPAAAPRLALVEDAPALGDDGGVTLAVLRWQENEVRTEVIRSVADARHLVRLAREGEGVSPAPSPGPGG